MTSVPIIAVINRIFDELRAAEEKHPCWPADTVYGSAILNEEAGELTQAALDFHDKPTQENFDRMKKEATQVGAVTIRFLLGLEGYENANSL